MEPTRPRPRPPRASKSPDDRKVAGEQQLQPADHRGGRVRRSGRVLLHQQFPGGHQVRSTGAAYREGGAVEDEQGSVRSKSRNPRNGRGADRPLFEPERSARRTERNHGQSHAGNPRAGRPADGSQAGPVVHLLALRAGSRQRAVARPASRPTVFATSRVDRQPSPWTSYFVLLALIGGRFGLAFLLLRKLGGTSSAMAFGRSRGKLLAQEDIGVTL